VRDSSAIASRLTPPSASAITVIRGGRVAPSITTSSIS
jgi:hypothetical protein